LGWGLALGLGDMRLAVLGLVGRVLRLVLALGGRRWFGGR
jgi:hypothetical protein